MMRCVKSRRITWKVFKRLGTEPARLQKPLFHKEGLLFNHHSTY
jgi:hypothetical protein